MIIMLNDYIACIHQSALEPLTYPSLLFLSSSKGPVHAGCHIVAHAGVKKTQVFLPCMPEAA